MDYFYAASFIVTMFLYVQTVVNHQSESEVTELQLIGFPFNGLVVTCLTVSCWDRAPPSAVVCLS